MYLYSYSNSPDPDHLRTNEGATHRRGRGEEASSCSARRTRIASNISLYCIVLMIYVSPFIGIGIGDLLVGLFVLYHIVLFVLMSDG